jgi:prolyl oligopeptidase
MASIVTIACVVVGQESVKGLVYPPTRKVEQVDDYHGVKVADPYRWLEDARAEEARLWVEAQNKVTFGYLAGMPERFGTFSGGR